MPSEWREVLDRRNRTSKTKRLYENDQPTRQYGWDGMVGTSLHYEEAGEWLEVDPRIVPSSEPGWDWEMRKSHWRFLVRNGGWFAAEKQGVGIGFRLERVAYLNIQTKEWQTIRTANYTTPTMEIIDHGNDLLANPLGKLIWHNLFPGVDFEIHVSGDGIHEEIKVSQAARDAMPVPPYPAADTYLVMVYQVDWGQVPGLADDDGDIDYDTDFERQARLYLKNHQGQIITALPASRAWVPSEFVPSCLLGEARRGLLCSGVGCHPIQVLLRKRFVKIAGQHYLLVGAPVLALNALPEGTIIFDPDVDEQVGANLDDAGHAKSACGYFATGASYDLISVGLCCSSGECDLGTRFQTVDVPKSPDNVTTATLSLYFCVAACGAVLHAKVRGEAIGDAAAFSTEANYNGRDKTTAGIDWDWTAGGTWNASPEIKTIVQEIVNGDDWVANNDLVIFVFDDGSGAGDVASFYDYETDPAKAAKLHIEYTVGGGVDYPVSMSLSRVAAMTGIGQAGALGNASLGRSAGVTDGGQGAGLAAASLARSAGMSPTRVMGVARTVSLARTARVTDAGEAASLGTTTLARGGGILASALGAALAAASLARQAGVTDTGQAATLGSALLGRTIAIAEGGLATTLAATLLTRLAGLSDAGQAASLTGVTLNRDGSISASALAAALAAASLARQAGVAGAGGASASADTSLSRQAGISGDGLASALADTCLGRQAGMALTASAQTLASALLDIFQGLSVSRSLDVAVSFVLDHLLGLTPSGMATSEAVSTLALALGIDESAIATALADTSLARDGGMSSTGLAAALVSASLSRQAGLIDAGQASGLSDLSLARDGGLGVSSLAAALASAMLSRSDGMSQEGSAQALASVLTEIFEGLSIARTKAVAAALALALALGIDESAQASVAASVSLTREQSISLLAEMIAITLGIAKAILEHQPDIIVELEHWPDIIAKLTHEAAVIIEVEID